MRQSVNVQLYVCTGYRAAYCIVEDEVTLTVRMVVLVVCTSWKLHNMQTHVTTSVSADNPLQKRIPRAQITHIGGIGYAVIVKAVDSCQSAALAPPPPLAQGLLLNISAIKPVLARRLAVECEVRGDQMVGR